MAHPAQPYLLVIDGEPHAIEISYCRDVQRLRDEGVFYADEEPSIATVAYHLVRVGFIAVPEDAAWHIEHEGQIIASN